MSKNYVKKYNNHDVPDGATHYDDGSLVWNEAFYKVDGLNVSSIKINQSRKDWYAFGSQLELPSNAIELPEQDLPNWDEQDDSNAVWIEDKEPDKICDLSGWYELFGEYYRNLSDSCKIEKGSDMITVHKRPIAIEDKEWLPTVGETIRISFEDVDHAWITNQEMNIDGNDVTLLGVTTSSKGQRIYTFEDEDGYCDCYPHDCFIPIKSMDEVYKEEFISWAKGGLSYSLEERAFAYRIIKELADNLKSMPNKGEG